MKSIWIISVRPNHVCNILNGLKTQELRTRIGNIKEGDEVHIYCCKGKDRLYEVLHKGDDCYGVPYKEDKPCFVKGYSHAQFPFIWNGLGQVVAKFIVGKVEKLEIYDDGCVFIIDGKQSGIKDALNGTCLTEDELLEYIGYGDDNSVGNETAVGYRISITHLEIFDKPRELGEYLAYKAQRSLLSDGFYYPITRAPQSYCKAWIEE